MLNEEVVFLYIFKMSQFKLSSSLEIFGKVNVGDPVRRLYIKDDDTFYVMGNKTVRLSILFHSILFTRNINYSVFCISVFL